MAFCFSCKIKPYQNGVFSERKEYIARGAMSVFSELTPIKKGGKSENSRVVPFIEDPFALSYMDTHLRKVTDRAKMPPLRLY